jgi:hypothetical protein
MGLLSDRIERARKRFSVPEYGQLCRTLGLGLHPYLDVFPRAAQSPGMRRVAADPLAQHALLSAARVRISAIPGYAFIDTRTPCISLSWVYYKIGTDLDLYLDLLHELTHLRQLQEGADLWDHRFSYVDRITEIEGYAVAAEEGRRLGMTESELARHLHNPWMSAKDVARLKQHIAEFLAKAGPLPT